MRLLPDKYARPEDSTLGLASELVRLREQGGTVSMTWNRLSRENLRISFDEFCEALSLLYMIGVVTLDSGTLIWRTT